ncbi:hypothetical protein ABLG96_04770 [Nakamurella sp. A5-74]|uniref:Uncharacterized protein n=1 Tax=Nakamurella sp. A5-74 TaxID=3158264 RepID=A0AAU8DUW2_9ACTN
MSGSKDPTEADPLGTGALGVELGGRVVRGTDVVPVIRADDEPLVEPGVEPGVEPEVEPGVEPEVEPGVEPGVEPEVEPGVEPEVEDPDALPVLDAAAEELVVEVGTVGVPVPGWASAPLQALSSKAAARAAIDARRGRFG